MSNLNLQINMLNHCMIVNQYDKSFQTPSEVMVE